MRASLTNAEQVLAGSKNYRAVPRFSRKYGSRPLAGIGFRPTNFRAASCSRERPGPNPARHLCSAGRGGLTPDDVAQTGPGEVSW